MAFKRSGVQIPYPPPTLGSVAGPPPRRASTMKRIPLPQRWPEPPFRIALVEPEIAGNTGAIARLCAATGSELHLVEPLGFRLTDAHLKRAGLDYWEHVSQTRHRGLDAFLAAAPKPERLFFFSTRASRSYTDECYRPGDTFVFGSESRGLPEALLRHHADQTLGIPIRLDHVRSLNVVTAAAIVLYEALRQQGPGD